VTSGSGTAARPRLLVLDKEHFLYALLISF
jgi:hypothetical protein